MCNSCNNQPGRLYLDIHHDLLVVANTDSTDNTDLYF